MKLYQYGVLGLSLLLPMSVLADFQYQETTQITGGSLLSMMKMMGHFSHAAKQAGEPTVSEVYVQANRMARVDDQTMQIIDLDKETVTNVDLEKHTYTQMTFEQMRQRMQQAMEQAKEKQAQEKASSPSQPEQNNVDMKFIVHVRDTGAAKQVSGLNAQESILTMQMEGTDKTSGQKGAFAITSDMWMVPDIPGSQELKEFEKKFAVKMGNAFAGSGIMANMSTMQPGLSAGMSDMKEEVSKLKGTPVEQIVRIGATADGAPLPAASEAPLPPTSSGPQMPSAGDVAKESAASAIAGKLGGLGGFGGFGGFGHKKKQAPPPPEEAQPAQGSQQAQTASVLMESKTEMASFSTAPIDPSKFAVPAGFTQVQPRPIK